MKYFGSVVSAIFLITFSGCLTSDKKQEIVFKEDQLWALALTGIMTEVNHDNFDTLYSNQLNKRYRDIYLEVLSRDWGIYDKEDLLEQLEANEYEGHAKTLEYIKENIAEFRLDPEPFYEMNYYRFVFVNSNWDLFKDRTILAWDLGRNIALCRWGYDVGFLTEDEAWEKIMYYARKIQPLYNSWEEYGFDYFLGRIFWVSGSGEEETFRQYIVATRDIYKYLTDDGGYWSTLEWNVDLSN